MKKLLLSIVLISFINISFAANQREIQAAFDDYIASAKLIAEKTKTCSASSYQNEKGLIVKNEILFTDNKDPNRYTLMTSKAKLNNLQKSALKEWLLLNQKCRDENDSLVEKMPFKSAIYKYRSDMDDVYVKLLSNRITIGEANTLKKDIEGNELDSITKMHQEYVEKINKEFKEANAIDQQNDAARKQEAANDAAARREKAAILMQYMNGNKPYQLPMPQVQQPIIRPSTNTNCISYGNQINCQSQ